MSARLVHTLMHGHVDNLTSWFDKGAPLTVPETPCNRAEQGR